MPLRYVYIWIKECFNEIMLNLLDDIVCTARPTELGPTSDGFLGMFQVSINAAIIFSWHFHAIKLTSNCFFWKRNIFEKVLAEQKKSGRNQFFPWIHCIDLPYLGPLVSNLKWWGNESHWFGFNFHLSFRHLAGNEYCF